MDSRAPELLQLYGLSEREALVYVEVLRQGSLSAGDIARTLRLRRTEAYRLVKRLLDVNLIVASAGKPVKYSPQPMASVVATMMEAQMQKLKKMEGAREQLLSMSRGLPAQSKAAEQRFRLIQGREGIYRQITKMIDGSTSTLNLLLTRNDLAQSYNAGIADKLDEAAGRGTKVKVVSQIDANTIESADALSAKCELRHSNDASMGRLVVSDVSQTLTSLVLDASPGQRNEKDVAIWSDSKNYAEMMTSLFDVAYAAAVPIEDRMKVVRLQEEFGDKVKTFTDVLRATLPEAGWTVDVPGRIAGGSGENHEFPATLRRGGSIVAVDIILATDKSDLRGRAVASIMKKVDLGGPRLIIVSREGFDEDTEKLAELLNVTMVAERDTVDAVARLKKVLAASS